MSVTLKDWLRALDASAGLERYCNNIAQHFSSSEELARMYVVLTSEGPVFDERFFEDFGVQERTHQEIFQRFFLQQGQRREAGREPHSWGWGSWEKKEVKESVQEEDWRKGSNSWRWGSWGSPGWAWKDGWSGQSRWWQRDTREQDLQASATEEEQVPLRALPRHDFGQEPRRVQRASAGSLPRRRAHISAAPATLEEQRSQSRSTSPPATSAPSRRSSRRKEEPEKPPRGVLDDWLRSLDKTGALCCYRSPLEDFFDTAEQVFLAYTTPPTPGAAPKFDTNFFLEAGISDNAHQRLFEQWFQSQLERPSAQPSSSKSELDPEKKSGRAKPVPHTAKRAPESAKSLAEEAPKKGGSKAASAPPRPSPQLLLRQEPPAPVEKPPEASPAPADASKEAVRARSEERPSAKEQRQSSELAAKLRAAREAAEALPEIDESKPHATVALLGQSGSGKSALLGALLRVGGAWDQRAFEKFVKEQQGSGSASSTAPVTRLEALSAETRRFSFLDPPGQKRCTAQVWAAVAQADLAVLVVAAGAELEASLGKAGQAREHAALAKSAGVEGLLVAVNKMEEAQWSKARFEEARAELLAALRNIGYREDQLVFVPLSARTSDNVGGEEEEECEACAWYEGGTLLETLEMAPLPARAAQEPLRASVLSRDKRGNAMIVSCRIEQGELEAGAALLLVPPGTECGAQTLEVLGKEVKRAGPGELVQLRLLGSQPLPGQVLCSPKEPLRTAAKFKVQMRLLDLSDEQPIVTAGFRCVLHMHQATEDCEVSKLIESVDPRSKKKEASPKLVRAPMVALCILVVSSGQELAVEAGVSRFARFSLRSDAGTIAVGKIVELPKSK